MGCLRAVVPLLCRNKINYNFSVSVLAWFDGAAIYLAVLIVSGFSSIVDYKKEKAFVESQKIEEASNEVSDALYQT